MALTVSTRMPAQQPLDAPTPGLNRNKRGVASPEKMWPQHSVLKISLLDMTDEQKAMIKDNINKWAPHTNLYFKFIDSPNGDIRIAADNNTNAGWSWQGTSAKKAPASEPTMSIGFATPSIYTAGKIQHEFGHALGLRHEHKHPDRQLDINKEKIYEDYKSRDKTRRQADHDIIDPFHHNDVKVSAYDRASIMHYGYSKEVMNDGHAIFTNTQLSDGDKQFIRSLYPPDNSPLGKLLNTAIRSLINT
ncbi:M12 family metallopeptidase [Pseudomonas sp. ICMP 8385]|uniref:M12 family metallopeptidase n=1 Tax=Pseudomonas sp. ICMP 8385 TaxID=1718920 RepID=UPI000C0852D8|nr:M12 family metallopeptidase [Pseudomonas sp. ICMP 8385]